MENKGRFISFHAARLIIGYLQNWLTESEKDELDDWINSSDENMNVFTDLTKESVNHVFDPDQLIIEIEEATELWIIAGLITRHVQEMNNEVEEKYLHELVEAA